MLSTVINRDTANAIDTNRVRMATNVEEHPARDNIGTA